MRLCRPPSLWAACCLAICVGVAGYCVSGMLSGHDIDEGVYYLAARASLTGHKPYVDYVYTQPPLSLLLEMPGALLGILIGRDDLGFAADRLLSTAALAATATLVWRLFRQRYSAPNAGLVAGLLALFDLTSSAVGHSVMLEPLVNLMTLLVLLAALDRRMMLAAALAALAALTKSQGAVAIVPFVAVGLTRRDWPGLIRGCGFIAVAGTITLGVGSWLTNGEFVQQVVLFQFVRPAEHSLAEQGGLLGWMLNPAIAVISLTGLLGLAGISRAIQVDKAATIALLAWLAAAFAMVTRSYSFYYHYWAQVSLPLAMIAGFLFLPLAISRFGRVRLAVIACLALLLAAQQLSWLRFRSNDGELAAIRAATPTILSDGFDPTGWVNIVLSRSLISDNGKLIVDAYATEQYLDLRPFHIADRWAPYTWDGLVGSIMKQSHWVWTDPRGERVLRPDDVALRASAFAQIDAQGTFRLYSRPIFAGRA